jgi:hypothetical protein
MTLIASHAPKLPSPPASRRPVTHATESHALVRDRTFPAAAPLDEIVSMLRDSDATGTLSVDFNEGGIGSIRFSERKRVTFGEK